jgi:threonine dehydratase
VLAASAVSGRQATILVGRTITPAKLEVLRRFETDRIRLEVLDVGSDEAELVARERSEADGSTYVAPYNDRWVVAGQGTIGLEVLDEWPACDTFLVPIGGGGLISGIALWAKTVRPATRVVGIQPTASPTVHDFLRTGAREPLSIGTTLADGVAGNLEPDSITWQLCRDLVDDVIVIDEDAIGHAIRWALDVPHFLLEGSAALPIAAMLADPGRFSSRNTCLVLTGRWVDLDVVRSVLAD